VSAIAARALAALRARPTATVVTALGLFFAGAILGSAVTTRDALGGGLGRAQRAAGTPDVVAQFAPTDAGALRRRIAGVANIRASSLRIVARPVGIAAAGRSGTAEADGLIGDWLGDGILIVAGRGLTGRRGEVVVERGLFRSWHLRLGQRLVVDSRRGPLRVAVVGVSVEPDDVAFPLASRPRIYLPYETVQDTLTSAPGRFPVTALDLWVRDRSQLPVTLAQLRAASFGLGSITLETRTGIRVSIDQAAGLISSVVGAFAVVALVAALIMIAAASHARVTRELQTIGVLRTIGFRPSGVAASYALEAALIALVAAGAGVIAGSLAVAGPASDLVEYFNGLPAAHPLGTGHLLVIAAAVAGTAIAAGAPALLAARRPVVQLMRGSAVVPAARHGVASPPSLLGARLILSRPVRLAAAVAAVAGGIAVVLVLTSLARTVIAARDDPQVLGIHYALLVDDTPGALETARATPGVAAAAVRYQTDAVDAYDLGEPLQVVAFGNGGGGVFAGRPLVSGRRPRAAGEADIGDGLATTLGLSAGQLLVVDPVDGGELRLRVAGVVREPSNDGRVVYTDAATLLACVPDAPAQVAVRLASGVSGSTATSRLEAQGLSVAAAGTLVPAGASFVDALVALLRAIAVVNGVAAAALIGLALVELARDRAGTVAVLRALGGGRRHVVALLGGAGAFLVLLALPAALVVEQLLLVPLIRHLLGPYSALGVRVAPGDLTLIALAMLAAGLAVSAAVAVRYARVPVLDVFRAD
jgi:ABC-type lipoprotein release transport system permease subunit